MLKANLILNEVILNGVAWKLSISDYKTPPIGEKREFTKKSLTPHFTHASFTPEKTWRCCYTIISPKRDIHLPI